MNLHQARAALDKLIEEGFGDCQLVVVDTRSGVSDAVSSFSHQIVDRLSGAAGWECEQKAGTPFVAAFIG